MTETVFLLLGSNLGRREQHLETAIDRLSTLEGLEIVATSPVYVSEPEDMQGENPSFLNQVVKGEFSYTPTELLRDLERIEQDLGRTDKGMRQPRTIDLDILLFGNQVIDTDRLIVPHRELTNRPFALVPLLTIDPELIHPGTGEPISSYLTDADRERVLLYRDHVSRNI